MLIQKSSDIVSAEVLDGIHGSKGLILHGLQPYRARMDVDVDTPLARFLRDYRNDNDLTQEQLAERLEIARNQLAGWERGRGISTKNRARLAAWFKVSPEVLGQSWDPAGPRADYKPRRKRRESDRGDFSDDIGDSGMAGFGSPPVGLRGVESVPDAQLFRKLHGYWLAMDDTQRRKLIAVAYSLAGPEPESHEVIVSPGKAAGSRP